MPVIRCKKCGYRTNSVFSKYWDRENKEVMEADECYLRYEKGEIVKGCSWNNAGNLTKKLLREYLGNKMIGGEEIEDN